MIPDPLSTAYKCGISRAPEESVSSELFDKLRAGQSKNLP
jgi:hypothetical protein